MKILIIGATGMLGHMVKTYLEEKEYEIITTGLNNQNTDYEYDANNDMEYIKTILDNENPNLVINCAGILNQIAEDNKTLALRLNSLLPHYLDELSNEINDNYEVTSDIYVVSKLVKQELTKNALYSLLIASIGIVIYVSFRFKFNYAISGLIALFHDVLIVILMFAIFKIEINSLFIAAILTIIGYSINDTIVTFDMIRQTYKDKYKNDIKDINKIDELVNTSVRLTLGRSIITTLTTILPVICLIIMGAKEIVNFNIALLIGFIAGVYSSIFISNQIWAILEKRSIKNPKEDDEDDDDELNEYTIRGVNS